MIQVKKTFLVGIFFITLLSGFFTYSTLHAQTPDFSNPEVRRSYGLSPEEERKASGDGNSIIGGWLQDGIEGVLQVITQITAFFLWVAAVFFNNFIYYAVAESAIRDNPFIAIGWQFFRDLANMLFIFIIMYIGISTMLGLGGSNTRSLLVRVIAVAILINFSLAMTRVVIDASNIAALGFYDAFPAGTAENTPGGKTTIGKYYGYPNGSKNIAAPFMNYSGIALLKGNEQFKAWSINEKTDSTPLVISYVATAIMHVIAIFIFGAGGILFLIRMIMLWVLMILAPIAFISYATPHMESHFKKWWSLLLKQSFFAVAFLALIYMSARLLNSASFFKSLEIASNNGFLGGILGVIIQFAFVAGLLIMSLTVSQSLGAYGASTLVNWGKKKGIAAAWNTGGFAGRHTLGRGANSILETEWVKKKVADNPRIASVLLRPVEATAKAKYGGKKNYQDALKADTKRMEDLDKYATTNKYGEDIKRTNSEGVEVTNKEIFRQSIGVGKTKEETLANMQSKWLPSRREAIRALNKKSGEEKKKKGMKEKITEQKEVIEDNIKKTQASLDTVVAEINEIESNAVIRGGTMTDLEKSQYRDKISKRTILEEKLERFEEKKADLDLKEAEGDRLDKIEGDINKKPEKEDKGDKGDAGDKK